MAYEDMNYDPMGNYTGFNNDQTEAFPVAPQEDTNAAAEEERLRREELERQRRERESASAVVHKQQIETRADGSQTHKTTTEVPAPIAPASYNQSIAQQESGNNPNIGYHNPQKSTAYGTYGMTQGAYADARRANPNLPQDITQATPEQQTQAMNAFTQQNAGYLKNYGVEPTQQNLSAAHFLGAKGLSDYLKSGYISPQAAAANGGYDKVRQIVNTRLGGGNAPASGAVNQMSAGGGRGNYPGQTQAQPGPGVAVATGNGVQGGPIAPEKTLTSGEQVVNEQPQQQAYPADNVINDQVTAFDNHAKTYEAVQNDPTALMKLGTSEDPNVPEWLKERSRNRAADLVTQQRDYMKGQADLQAAAQDPNKLNKLLRDRTEGGNWAKAIFFAAIGAKQSAQDEAAKLGIGDKDQIVQGADGKSYVVTMTKNGLPKSGVAADGTPLTSEQLVNVVGGAQGMKNAQTHTGKMQDIKTGAVYYERTTPQGIQLVDHNGNRYTGPSNNLRPFGIGSDIGTKNQIQLNELQNKLAYAGPTERAKIVAENEAKFGPLDPATRAQALGQVTGTVPTYGQQGGGNVPAPAPAPAQGGNVQGGAQVNAPVAPSGGAQPAPVNPAAPAPGSTIAERETGQKVTAAEQEAFVRAGGQKETIGQAASDGQSVGNARRQQLDIIKRNPSMLNIMNGTGTQFDQARNIITRLATGDYSGDNKEQLYKDIKATGMSQAEQAALIDFANLNTTINAKTLRANSGAGSISDAEQRANKDANIGNVDRIPAYAALSGLHRSQFAGDLQASKQAFLDAHPEIKSASQFNSAWQKEEANLLKGYQGIARSRLDAIGTPPPADASKEALAAYKDRVFRAFEAYPAPIWDAGSNKWNYQTANAKRAAMKQILGQ
jgi:hypothetical protein